MQTITKNLKLFFIVLFVLNFTATGYAVTVYPNNPDQQSHVGANILKIDVGVTETQEMHFGGMYPDTKAGGVVTLMSNGSRSSSNEKIIFNSNHPSRAGIFEIKGPEGLPVTITHDTETDIANENGITMRIQLLNVDKDAFPISSGGDIVKVKGDLILGPDQPLGEYNGTYKIVLHHE